MAPSVGWSLQRKHKFRGNRGVGMQTPCGKNGKINKASSSKTMSVVPSQSSVLRSTAGLSYHLDIWLCGLKCSIGKCVSVHLFSFVSEGNITEWCALFRSSSCWVWIWASSRCSNLKCQNKICPENAVQFYFPCLTVKQRCTVRKPTHTHNEDRDFQTVYSANKPRSWQ